MLRLRSWLTTLVAWLFALYSVERVYEPINLASFVYVQAAVCAIGIIWVRQLQRISVGYLLAVSLTAVLGLKSLLGYELAGPSLPLTVTELVAIGVTVLFSCQIARCLQAFEVSAVEVAAMDFHGRSTDFESAQRFFYHELRRARQFDRPAALLTLVPTDNSLKMSMNRLLQEVQQKTLDNYARLRISNLVAEQTRDYAAVAHRDNVLMLLLPEASPGHAKQIADQLQRTALDQLGLQLQVGLASFPDEEVTLAGLIDRAERHMRRRTAVSGVNADVKWFASCDVAPATTGD